MAGSIKPKDGLTLPIMFFVAVYGGHLTGGSGIIILFVACLFGG